MFRSQGVTAVVTEAKPLAIRLLRDFTVAIALSVKMLAG